VPREILGRGQNGRAEVFGQMRAGGLFDDLLIPSLVAAGAV
jgi:hypothetical protein